MSLRTDIEVHLQDFNVQSIDIKRDAQDHGRDGIEVNVTVKHDVGTFDHTFWFANDNKLAGSEIGQIIHSFIKEPLLELEDDKDD